MKKTLLSLFILLCLHQSKAQEVNKKLAISVTTGYVTGVENYWDEKHGFHLGANLYKSTVERLSWDAQLSMNFTSGQEAAAAISALSGGRIYLNKGEKTNRYFFNMLIGPSLFLASGYDYTETTMQIGYSAGFYGMRKHFLFGVGIERQEVFAFKIGYTF